MHNKWIILNVTNRASLKSNYYNIYTDYVSLFRLCDCLALTQTDRFLNKCLQRQLYINYCVIMFALKKKQASEAMSCLERLQKQRGSEMKLICFGCSFASC